MDHVDIFSYQDFRAFLRDYYLVRRKKDRKFSIRFFARRAGLRSQNYLKVVMDGRRSLTSRNVPKFVKGLGLDLSQAEYFEALVNLNQARDASERKEYLIRLEHLKKKKEVFTLEDHQMNVVDRWYNLVIYEMSCQENFKPDPHWISRRLRARVTPEQVRESLDTLVKAGLLKAEGSQLIPKASQLTSPAVTREAVPKEKLKTLHRDLIDQGFMETSNDAKDVREIRSLTIGLTAEQVPVFQAKVQNFQRELNSTFSSGKGTEIYQLNIQFFKMTKSSDEV